MTSQQRNSANYLMMAGKKLIFDIQQALHKRICASQNQPELWEVDEVWSWMKDLQPSHQDSGQKSQQVLQSLSLCSTLFHLMMLCTACHPAKDGTWTHINNKNGKKNLTKIYHLDDPAVACAHQRPPQTYEVQKIFLDNMPTIKPAY